MSRYATEQRALSIPMNMIPVPYEKAERETQKAALFPTYGWLPKVAVRFDRAGKVLPYCVHNCLDTMMISDKFADRIPATLKEDKTMSAKSTVARSSNGRFVKKAPISESVKGAPKRGRPAGLTFKNSVAIVADYKGERYVVATCAYHKAALAKLNKLANIKFFRGTFAIEPTDALPYDGNFGDLLNAITSKPLRAALVENV